MKFTTDERRWDAVVQRRMEANGHFVYAVRTTGVFCRPSCASRRPVRTNVVFFSDPGSALNAGFRACRRCHPLDVGSDVRARRMVEACRRLEQDTSPRTVDVARLVGFSPYYFQRLFKKWTGVTPQAYRRRVLAERAKKALAGGSRVIDAVYEGGYGASSRFYEGAARELGMQPKAARRGGEGQTIRFTVRRCSLGVLLVAWTARGICDVAFAETEREVAESLVGRYPRALRQRHRLPSSVRAVLEMAERPRQVNVPLDIQGTAFQQRVWDALRRIPFGTTKTYSEIATSVGAPKAARAVANACASNRLALVVPCHRVVATNGELSGYRWGLERKRALLTREGAFDRDGPDGKE